GRNQGDLWDSGKVNADTTIQIPYGGKPLTSGKLVWWKAQVWDRNGNASAWSAPARWSMGLLSATDWKGKWIGLDGGEPKPELAMGQWIGATDPAARTVYFRRTLELSRDKPFSDVIVSVAGSG